MVYFPPGGGRIPCMINKLALSPRLPFRLLVIIVIVSFVLNPPLLGWGNPVPGRWEKAAMTKPGEKITIHLQGGDKLNLTFVLIDDESLNCVNQYGGEVKFEKPMVDKIIVHKAGKYARTGFLWGAVGGAAVGGALTAPSGEWTTLGKFMWAGLFAGVGALGGGITGAVLGAPGETVYISKEAALAEAR